MANLSSSVTERENYVRRLQEWAQGRGLPLPGYRETPSEEMIDSYNFRVQFGFVVSVPTMESVEGRGDGRTKKDAKQAAAKALYETLTDAPAEGAAPRDSPSKPGNSLCAPLRSNSNAIRKLQEMAQKRNLPPPDYEFDSAGSGPFVCTVKAFGALAQGGGKNKKEAKHEAAKELWMVVGQ